MCHDIGVASDDECMSECLLSPLPATNPGRPAKEQVRSPPGLHAPRPTTLSPAIAVQPTALAVLQLGICCGDALAPSGGGWMASIGRGKAVPRKHPCCGRAFVAAGGAPTITGHLPTMQSMPVSDPASVRKVRGASHPPLKPNLTAPTAPGGRAVPKHAGSLESA